MHEKDGEGGNPSNGTLVALQLFSGHLFADKSERMQRRATKTQPADIEILKKSNVYNLAREQLCLGRNHNHAFMFKIINKIVRYLPAGHTQSSKRCKRDVSKGRNA